MQLQQHSTAALCRGSSQSLRKLPLQGKASWQGLQHRERFQDSRVLCHLSQHLQLVTPMLRPRQHRGQALAVSSSKVVLH